MKRTFRFFCLLGLLLFASTIASAQSGKLPPFRIMQANGKVFKAENLPFEKPIVIIYFSPECEHCTEFMKSFLKKASDFKKASVVLITFLPVQKVAKFNHEYKINTYPNITTGTEGDTFFVRNYYNIMDIPFAALYDKNGNLITSYQKTIPLTELAGKLKTLL